MLVSNMLFGQGMWTPWQMFAMGLLGFFAGIIFSKKRNTLALCVYSLLSVLIIYGGIMNISTALTYTTDLNLSTVTAYIVSGIPFDLIHAVSTVIFVLITGDALLKKCCRLRVKFGLFQ
jgi:energy-coupling factor transport system ATP-binding protein